MRGSIRAARRPCSRSCVWPAEPRRASLGSGRRSLYRGAGVLLSCSADGDEQGGGGRGGRRREKVDPAEEWRRGGTEEELPVACRSCCCRPSVASPASFDLLLLPHKKRVLSRVCYV